VTENGDCNSFVDLGDAAGHSQTISDETPPLSNDSLVERSYGLRDPYLGLRCWFVARRDAVHERCQARMVAEQGNGSVMMPSAEITRVQAACSAEVSSRSGGRVN
jgi:hypothetical protein